MPLSVLFGFAALVSLFTSDDVEAFGWQIACDQSDTIERPYMYEQGVIAYRTVEAEGISLNLTLNTRRVFQHYAVNEHSSVGYPDYVDGSEATLTISSNHPDVRAAWLPFVPPTAPRWEGYRYGSTFNRQGEAVLRLSPRIEDGAPESLKLMVRFHDPATTEVLFRDALFGVPELMRSGVSQCVAH